MEQHDGQLGAGGGYKSPPGLSALEACSAGRDRATASIDQENIVSYVGQDRVSQHVDRIRYPRINTRQQMLIRPENKTKEKSLGTRRLPNHQTKNPPACDKRCHCPCRGETDQVAPALLACTNARKSSGSTTFTSVGRPITKRPMPS